MKVRNGVDLLKYGLLGVIIGNTFNIVWAVIFWNSDLYMWHWLAVPIGMGIVMYGGIKWFIGTKS